MEDTQNPDSGPHDFSHRNWIEKFKVSMSGLRMGIRGRRGGHGCNSFAVHIPVAALVLGTAILLGVGWFSLALILFCIGLVMVAELLNTSLELMAKAVTERPDEHVGAALDVASGAVLMASLTAAAVGLIVLGVRVFELLAG